MVHPSPGGFGQIDREELDDQQIIVRSSHSTCEVAILQSDARVGFFVVFGDVARCSKASWKMSIAHGASEYLGTRPFGTEATSFAIVAGPTTWVPHALLGLCAIVTWVMPLVHLLF
jgi:hypothetical protein